MVSNLFLIYLIATITLSILPVRTQLPIDTLNLRQIACSVDDDCLTYLNAKCYNNVCSLCDDSPQCTSVGRLLIPLCGTNDDCTDPTASYCDSTTNTCQPCSLSPDCTHLTTTPYCMGGVCGTNECNTNTDCTDITKSFCDSSTGANLCQVCNNDDTQCTRFPDTQYCDSTLGCVQCTSTNPCSDPTLVCFNGECVQCGTNDDCTDPSASFCDSTTNTCQPCSSSPDCTHLTTTPYCLSGVCGVNECNTNTDCTDITKSFCDSSTGTNLCQVCNNDDTQCTRFPGTQYCDSSLGCVQCTSTNPCSDPTLVCFNGECVGCGTNNDCTDTSASFCESTTNTCQPCSSSPDCTHLTTTPYCLSGVCGTNECNTNTDCTDITKSFCDSSTGANLCQVCNNDDTQCTRFPDTQYCDSTLGCVQCTSTNPCSDPTLVCFNGECVGCGTNNDCIDTSASFCDSTTNTCQPCSSSPDCTHLTTTPYCLSGVCGINECNTNTDCTDITKSFCDSSTGANLCQVCNNDDTQCTRFPDTQYCDSTLGCVQCTSTNPCSDPTLVCFNGECVGCGTNDDCTDTSASFCDPTTQTCQACSSSSDCTHLSATPYCLGASCSNIECVSDTDCTDITKSFCDISVTNLCQVCNDDSQCSRFTDTKYCSPTSTGCVECADDTNCPLVTASFCDITGAYTCEPCTDDSHCANFPSTPNCQINVQCVECVDNDDCNDPTKSYCDTGLNTCSICTTDPDCSHLTSTPVCAGSSTGCVECMLSTSCTTPLKSYCDNMVCSTCTGNTDCDQFSVEKVCSFDSSLGCVECMADTDCLDPTKSFCDMSSHTCSVCTDSTQCTHLSATQYCSSTPPGCVECLDDTPCTDITLSTCNLGTNVCEACSDDSQCTKFSLTPLCKLNQLCVECLDSTIDCNYQLRSYCEPTSNACQLCTSNSDCHFTVETVCSFDATLGCVECMTNSDCQDPTKSFCDTSTHTCTLCSDSTQCTHLSTTQYCSSTPTGCVQCLEDTPCTDITLSYCDLGTNLCEPCVDDTHCARFSLTPVCDLNTQCVQCLDSTLHCTNQLVSYCNPTSETCQLCTSNTDCHFTVEKVCSFDASLGCVECMSNLDCQDPTRSYCDLSTHTCQLCSNDPQCSHLSATPYCSLTLASCTECLVTDHCTTLPKSYCNPTTLVCQTCADDSQCAHITADPYCSLTDLRCAECLVSDTCLSTLESYCSPSLLECQPCTDHSHCTHLTPTPLCYSSAVGCVNCITNNDCPSRFLSYCNQTPHKCQACNADNQCTHITNNNKCYYGECVIYSSVCYPDYPVTITQLKSLNDFDLVVSPSLVALIDIPSTIQISLAGVPTTDYAITITRLSNTDYDIYFDVKKTIPNTVITIALPCPRNATNVYGDIIKTTTVKRILYGSAELKAGLSTMGDAGDSATTAMSSISSAMVVIGANPALLWAMLSLIQTFYYMLFINVVYPANVQAFFPIFQIAQLNFIPNPMWIIFPNINDVSLPVPEKFEENDVNGLFLDNAGNMLLLWIGNLVFYGFSFLVMRYTRNRPQVLTFVCSKLVSMFEWSGTFRIFISSYMELTLAAFLQIRVLTYSTGLLASSSVCGILFTGFGIFFPILAYFIVRKYDTRPQYILVKFGTLIEEYNLKHPFSKYFTVLYIVRNLVIAASLVYLHDYNYIQIGVLISLNFTFAYLIWKFKPYENKVSNMSNFVTELVFAFVHIIIFVLIHDDHLDFLNDPQRIQVGWGIMVGCAIIFAASIILAFAQQYTVIKKTIFLLRKFLKKAKDSKGGKGKLKDIKIKKADRLEQSSSDLKNLSPGLRRSSPDTLHTYGDTSTDMSSANLMSSPGLPPKGDPLEIISNAEERKLAALQRLARLNFESRINKIRLAQIVNVDKKEKPKSKCAN